MEAKDFLLDNINNGYVQFKMISEAAILTI
jgi:hypothetical protein